MMAGGVCSGRSESVFVKTFRDAHNQDRLGGTVQNLVGGAAEHGIADHGVAMSTHDDQVDSVFVGGRQDNLSRLAFFTKDFIDSLCTLQIRSTFLLAQASDAFPQLFLCLSLCRAVDLF
jgi:hypothetical protein